MYEFCHLWISIVLGEVVVVEKCVFHRMGSCRYLGLERCSPSFKDYMRSRNVKIVLYLKTKYRLIWDIDI